MVLILITYSKAREHDGAEANLFSLISKCTQQDAEKLKPIICTIGESCGVSVTFIDMTAQHYNVISVDIPDPSLTLVVAGKMKNSLSVFFVDLSLNLNLRHSTIKRI